MILTNVCLSLCVTYLIIGYIFPALIASLVPFRTYIVSRLFSEEDLVYLDPLDEAFTSPTTEDEDIEATDEIPVEELDDENIVDDSNVNAEVSTKGESDEAIQTA